MTISSNSTGIQGFNNLKEDITPQFTQGVVAIANGTDYVYVQTLANVAVGATFGVDKPSFTANASGTGYTLDVPAQYSGNVAILTNNFFWAKKVSSPF